MQDRSIDPDGSRTADLGEQTLSYEVDADGRYRVEVGGRRYGLRQWTWGEKNRAAGTATRVDAETGALMLDLAIFNELVLLSCLVEIEGEEGVTLDVIRNLHPAAGDTLLAFAYWLNELSDEEKKNLSERCAAVRRIPTSRSFACAKNSAGLRRRRGRSGPRILTRSRSSLASWIALRVLFRRTRTRRRSSSRKTRRTEAGRSHRPTPHGTWHSIPVAP